MKIDFYHIDAFEVPIYEPIWRQLTAMGVTANLVGVPGEKNTADFGWFDYDRFVTYCQKRNIPFKTTPDLTADIAVTTQNKDILRNYNCPKIRIMYGPILYPAAWGLQPHTVKPFDAVLTHSEIYTNFYQQWLPRARLPVVGYPRFDDFFAKKLQREVIRKKWNVGDSRPVVIFMPTWGDNTGFDLFLPALLALKNQYQIILRPHHCTLRLEQNRMEQINSSGCVILDDAFDLSEIYAAADVVIADVRSGGLFESCLCEVPTVGMVINPAEETGWLAENNVGKIVSLCSNPSKLAEAIKQALSSKEQANQQKNWAEKFVAYRDGTAAMHAAQELVKLASLFTKSVNNFQKNISTKKSIELIPISVAQTNLMHN